MKICVDGPKGSGKTSLAVALTQELNGRHEYVSYKRVYSMDGYLDIINECPNRDVILERGPLSAWIYTWLRDGVMECDTWTKLACVSEFKSVFDAFDQVVILYASDPNDLNSAIQTRSQTDGKGANDEELKELHATNAMFKFFGEFFRDHVGCDNIKMVDVSDKNRLNQFDQSRSIISDIAETSSGSVIPFNNL